MTDDKRTRVAKALHASQCSMAWIQTDDAYEHHLEDADAAIAALEEPAERTLIEQVAEAIWIAEGCYKLTEESSKPLAKAAIEKIREGAAERLLNFATQWRYSENGTSWFSTMPETIIDAVLGGEE